MLWNLQVVLCFFISGYVGAQVVESPKILEQIEVHGSRLAPKSIQIAEGAAETIHVENSQGQTPTQALQQTPSVWIQQGSSQSVPHIYFKGQFGNENRFFLEGVPLTDGQFNSDFLLLVPFRSVDRIDIYPDGPPVALNTDGLGGAMDLHLTQMSKKDISVKTGSFGFLELEGSQSLGRKGSGIGLVAGRSNENFNFYDNGGTPFNLNDDKIIQRSHNKFLKIGLLPVFELHQSKSNHLRYFGLNSYRALEIPGAVSLPFYGNLQQVFHLSALKNESWLIPTLKSETLVYARLNIERFRREPNQTATLKIDDSDSFWKNLSLKQSFHFLELLPTSIEQSSSLSYETYDLNVLDSRTKIQQSTRLDIPVSLGADIPWSQLSLKPAVMAQYSAFQGVLGKTYFLYSPRLGAAVKEPWGGRGVVLEGIVGQYYRVPSMLELYGNGHTLVASKDLLPERAAKVSLGGKFERKTVSTWLSKLTGAYSYSVANSENLIVYIENSQNSKLATNLGSGLIQSHDISLDLSFGQNLEIRSTGNIYQGKNTSDISYYYGKKIPNLPDFLLRQSLDYRVGSFDFNYQFQWVGGRFCDLANLKKLSSTTEHSLFAGVDAQKMGRFRLELVNLFDAITATTFVSGFSTLDNTTGIGGYPAPGRRFYLNWYYEL